MKKLAIALFAFFIFAQSYAQTQDCIDIPFQPIFGVIGDADTANWLKHTSIPPDNPNPSFWSFRPSQEGQTNLVPFLSLQNENVGTVTLASPCFLATPGTTYKLSFTFVGLTPGFMNALSVYLVGNAPTLVDGTNPLTFSTQLLGTFTNIPFGASEFALLITPEDFSQIAGLPESYRIVFRSQNGSRSIPGISPTQFYVIGSFLTDIALTEAQNNNLQIVAMTNPLSNCNLNNEFLSFKVRNRGFETPTYNVCFRVSTGGGAFGNWLCSQPFPEEIPFNETVEVRLTNHPQTITAPTVIEAQIQIAGIPASDIVRTEINRTEIQNTPYGQSFDGPTFYQTWSIIPNRASLTDTTWHVPRIGNVMSGRAVIATSGDASYDRLVSGCIQLVAGTRYRISFTYSAFVNPNLRRPHSTAFSTDLALATTENLRLSVGRNNLPSETDITLMDLRGFNNTDERTIAMYFTPTETGAHFFGFLAHSDALSAGISIGDFSVVVAPEPPRTLPVFMSFEDFDNHEGWQMFSQNAIDSTVSGAPMRGWQISTQTGAGGNVAHGSVGLRTLSSPAGATGSVITQSENNNNWLISPPIRLEANSEIQIRYFRRAMLPNATEVLNVRVSRVLDIDSLSRLAPTFSDVVQGAQSNTFAEVSTSFTSSEGGIYFVTFQYNSQNGRAGNHGMSLDEISIQCITRAQQRNVSVVGLTAPAPACELGTEASFDLTLKNRTGENIPANMLGGFFRLINTTAGIDTVVRANRNNAGDEGTGNVQALGAYQTIRIGRTHDLSATGTWEVQAWIAPGRWVGDVFQTPEELSIETFDFDASDDTSGIVRTASTGEHFGRYDMGFESHENVHFWRISQTGNPRLRWSFINNPALAHTGSGSAFIGPSELSVADGQLQQHSMTSPCLFLMQGTTYFVSFFYRAVETHNNLRQLDPVELSTHIGRGIGIWNTPPVPSIDNREDLTSVTSQTWTQRTFYFRPTQTGVHYVILQAGSPRWSTGVVLDNFVILDSVAAHTPNLSLTRVWTVSADPCDFQSEDTLHVELRNNGLMPVVNPALRIQFRGQTHNETWTGTVPPDSTVIVRLNRRVAHAGFGVENVTVSLALPVNLSQETTQTIRSIKIEPIRPPFTVNFTQGGDISVWNNLPLSFDEQLQPTFAYWTFNSDGAFFQQDHQRALPGILASQCFILDAGEPHVIVYEYRRANQTSTENLQVLLERADGTLRDLYTHSSILSTSFVQNTVNFTPTGQAEERVRVRFLANHHILANRIYIGRFSLMTEYQASVVDLNVGVRNLLSIHPNPATTEVFVQSEQEISTLFIHDVRGQLIREIRVNSTEYHLNTTDFPAGVYVFTIVVGNERVSKRIIIND